MRRSVLDTVEKLKSKGHSLVRFEIPDVNEAVSLFYKVECPPAPSIPFQLLMPDGGAYTRSLYENDIVDPYLKQFVTLLKVPFPLPPSSPFQVPRCLRWVVSHLISGISPQMATICRSYVSDLQDLRYTQEMCDVYRKKVSVYRDKKNSR